MWSTFMSGSLIDKSMMSLSFVFSTVSKALVVPSGLQCPTAGSIDFDFSNGNSITSVIGWDFEV